MDNIIIIIINVVDNDIINDNNNINENNDY